MTSCDNETNDCTETLRELHPFIDGELTTEANTAVRHHLEQCPDCFGAFDFHAELKQVIADKCHNDELPADLVSRLERCFDTDFDGDGAVG